MRPNIRMAVERAAALDKQNRFLVAKRKANNKARPRRAKEEDEHFAGSAKLKAADEPASVALAAMLVPGLAEARRRKKEASVEARRLAAEKSAREADIAEHTAGFAFHVGEKKRALSGVEGARRQAEADAAALRVAEAKAAADEAALLRGREREERADEYATQVLDARVLQKNALVAVRAANAKPLCPPFSKSAEQWREAIKMANEAAAREAVAREMKRGAPFFDFPKSVADIATCTVAFFCLPRTRASVTGFMPWARVDEHMSELVTQVRSVLLSEHFKQPGEALVTLEDLRDELQRQGATTRMLRADGVSFSRFSSALVALTRAPPPRAPDSLLHLVPAHAKVNRVLPRFSDFAPVCATWLPDFHGAMAKYGADTLPYDYLALAELNPVKAVEQLELLNFKHGSKVFAKSQLEAVQLDVSRLHKGRLLNAAEFNIACIKSSVEEIRSQKNVKEFFKWITDPLLLHDPLRPKAGMCAVA